MIRKFYLADDDDDDIRFFGDALEEIDESIQFDSAGNGKELLEKLRRDKARPHVIFLDINMPEMNGWESLKNLKMEKSLRDIPVIMYSTSSSTLDGERALQLGAVAFYQKPTSFQGLKEFLKLISASRLGELKAVLKKISASKVHKLYSE
jgi:CheY-like chemotaxis protein